MCSGGSNEVIRQEWLKPFDFGKFLHTNEFLLLNFYYQTTAKIVMHLTSVVTVLNCHLRLVLAGFGGKKLQFFIQFWLF